MSTTVREALLRKFPSTDDPEVKARRKHPAKDYAWELRLQDELRSDFTIDETGSDAARAKFLAEHAPEAAEILANEKKRRARRAAKADDEREVGPLFDREADDSEEPDDD